MLGYNLTEIITFRPNFCLYNFMIIILFRDTYESLLCEVDPWSKMEVHHMKRNNRNYIRTESVSQRRRSDSFTFYPNI